MKAFDGRANREVAVATDGRVARRHASRCAPARHCAATPRRAAGDGCRSPNTPGPATSNVTSTASAATAISIPAAMRREDTISSGGVRSAIVDRIGREQTQQRRRESLRLTPLAIEIRLDATVLVRQPLLEHMRTIIATQPTQRPPQQRCNDTREQHDDRDAASQRDRGRELLALQRPDGERGDREDAGHRDRRGARIDMCAQSARAARPDKFRVALERSFRHLPANRQVAIRQQQLGQQQRCGEPKHCRPERTRLRIRRRRGRCDVRRGLPHLHRPPALHERCGQRRQVRFARIDIDGDPAHAVVAADLVEPGLVGNQAIRRRASAPGRARARPADRISARRRPRSIRSKRPSRRSRWRRRRRRAPGSARPRR